MNPVRRDDDPIHYDSHVEAEVVDVHLPTFIPRALRCACTDAHHYRGSALCPLTPADPWGVDGETP